MSTYKTTAADGTRIKVEADLPSVDDLPTVEGLKGSLENLQVPPKTKFNLLLKVVNKP
jgi:hypothetical protein